MKKTAIVFMCLVLVIGCAACGTSVKSGGETNNVQIPNPFTDYDSLADAEKAAGFTIKLPDKVNGLDRRLIQVMDGTNKMLQVFYGDDEALIRKRTGTDDISGDYNEYASVVEQNGVTYKGDGNAVFLAVWTANGYSYSVSVAAGLTVEEFAGVVGAVA